jgi:hypothetical protein
MLATTPSSVGTGAGATNTMSIARDGAPSALLTSRLNSTVSPSCSADARMSSRSVALNDTDLPTTALASAALATTSPPTTASMLSVGWARAAVVDDAAAAPLPPW